MPRGVVSWFNEERGFGFITPEGGGVDVFVAYNAIEGTGFRTLKENQQVEYEEATTDKGLKATWVRVI